jgi:uncharacterized sulfatase
MASISEEVRQNTIFIFTSDHGEYGSSHGLQGKGGTVYDEGIRVPLIIRDSRPNSYATDTGALRNQLTSSVDLLPMIVTMGNGGSTQWMTGNEYQQLYGDNKRFDLLSILGNSKADGRTYALHSTDEFVPDIYNFNGAPLHVIGLIQTDKQGSNKTKLGVYTNWIVPSASPDQATVINPLTFVNPPERSLEFYEETEFNPVTQDPLEIQSTADSPRAKDANEFLFNTLLGSELQAPLPTQTLRDAQIAAYKALVDYEQLVNSMASGQTPAAPEPEEVKRRAARVWAF